MNTEKRCSKCGTVKLTPAFSKNARNADGYCVWCKQCSLDQQRIWRAKNPDRMKELNQSYYAKNRESIRMAQSEYQAKNQETLRASAANLYQRNRTARDRKAKAYRDENPERARLYGKNWRSRNTHVVNAKSAHRRASLLKATPVWANEEAIKLVFFVAAQASKTTGIPHDVDHIVPITPPLVQGLDIGNPHPKRSFIGPLIPIVQGLHCEANLRAIPETINRLKSNTKWPDMPNISI